MIVVLTTILFVPSNAMGRFYIVGDGNGWRSGVDYQAWAANKFFTVGDVLGTYLYVVRVSINNFIGENDMLKL